MTSLPRTLAALLPTLLCLAMPLGAAPSDAATAPPESAATVDEATATGDAAAELPETGPDVGLDAGTAAEVEESRHAVRDRFDALLRQHRSEVGTILALDPRLLHNESFLAGYPDLARFVAAHPEVRRNPDFFVQHFRPAPRGGAEDILEILAVFSTFLIVALALGWLVRTVVEQKRWSRLARTQSEVHNKILDRFGSSDELLAYVQTRAGARFLESAPIAVGTERPQQNPPVARAVWLVQIGVVVAAAAVGSLLVSLRVEPEPAEVLFALGMFGLCIGLGFVGSAAVSLVLSRRLGLWQQPPAPAAALPEGEPHAGEMIGP